ncbi:unnamed protein product [Brachionus calyciflorus]|uniref:Uncharacterized protein n=1 Tax=Brachionus calyciflorus TaxID=104777 RepID=A0A814FGS9_9BILA|nr:unnamed protein product [Brachionus calyciflorus]
MSNLEAPPIRIGLDALNIQDSHHLRNALINCDDPLKAISDFQEENCISLPSLKPALNLLDLHSVKRLDFHVSIADELKENLIKKIEELSQSINASLKEPSPTYDEDVKKLEELLDKSFPLIFNSRLTPLILLIMKSLPKVNDNYLNFIKSNENLYSIAPIELKRQIWSHDTDFFMRELQPLFEKFTNYFDEILTYSDLQIPSSNHFFLPLNTSNIDVPILKENLMVSNTIYTYLFKTNKRHMTYVNEICKLIGNNTTLYQFTLKALTDLYLKTHDWFYSTLKSFIVNKYYESLSHENLLNLIGTSDAQTEMILKFGNLLHLCLKEKKIEAKRAKELETIMESKKFEKIFPDIAFILADPFVVDMLSRNVMSMLNKCVQNELLPRNCTELIFVLRLLSISLLAWEIVDSQTNKEPKIDSALITEYLPNLAYFITDFYEKLYDDSIAALTNQAQNITSTLLSSSTGMITSPTIPAGPIQTNSNVKTSPPIVLKISTKKLEILSSVKALIGENELCSTLFIYLVIVCFEINDWINLKALLPSIKYPNNNINFFEKWFMYQFFNVLTEKSVVEQFKHDWFVQLIFDDFLLAILKIKDEQLLSGMVPQASALAANTLYEQTYKLMDKLAPNYLSLNNFTRLVEIVKPKKIHPSTMQITYSKLRSKLEPNYDIQQPINYA